MARVEAVDDHVEVRQALPEYQDLLERADPTLHLGKRLPDDAFATLSAMYNNSYFFVTEPHTDNDCMYLNGSVPMSVRIASPS